LAQPTQESLHLAELPNGVRVVTLRMPRLQTAHVSVYQRAGSAHESRAINGISHVVEHMAFKGTGTRDARRINLDAERLGADVNAHTDKDHTAFHMRGLARDAVTFIDMLADIVHNATFPEDELERERQVLLEEFTEDEDDPMYIAFELFDRACYGLHPVAQPVIGSRRNIQRFTRADLSAYVQRQYTGCNTVLGVAGGVDVASIERAAQAAFGSMTKGQANTVSPAAYRGGVRTRSHAGSSQTHLVLGFPIPPLGNEDAAGLVAATLFGEGMSSPLMAELRERRGLVYYAACAADVFATHGQFVVEASMAPDKLDAALREVARLLTAQVARVDALDLERARNQLIVRRLRTLEKPGRRLEAAALDLFALGRIRTDAERLDRVTSVSATEVRDAFACMLAAGASAAITGHIARHTRERAREVLGRALAV
jgi:predicted Zn-dependent peptidase